MNLARAAFALCILLASVAWIAPTSAYKSALSGDRAVTAAIVAEGSGYSAPIVSACTSGISGTLCYIKIYNNATAAQTYTVTKQLDANSVVKVTWDVDGHMQVGGVATGNSAAIGSTSLVTIPITSCIAGCSTRHTYWMIQGANGGVLTSREEQLHLQVLNAP